MTRSLYSGSAAILLALAAPGFAQAETYEPGPWQGTGSNFSNLILHQPQSVITA